MYVPVNPGDVNYYNCTVVMGYTCSVEDCQSNTRGWGKNTTVFEFSDDEDLTQRWAKFAAGTRKNWIKTQSSRTCICIKHFESKCTSANNARNQLVKTMKPLPAIRDLEAPRSPEVAHMKAPNNWLFQED